MVKAFRINNQRKSCVATFFAIQLFNLFSFVYFFVLHLVDRATITQALMCAFSALFVCLPSVFERVFRFRVSSPVYIFCLVYAVCPMLGHSYGLYYVLSFWDKVLHLAGGVVFALFGSYLPKVFLKDNGVNYKLCAFTGLLFSIAVACVWEFIEFTLDSVFLTDMQKDTVLTQLHSYKLNELLGGELGEIARVDGVSTLVNGQYHISGYIDVGRTDTMYDLLIETAGAVGFFLAYLLDKGKRLALRFLPKEAKKPPETETESLPEVAVGEDKCPVK